MQKRQVALDHRFGKTGGDRLLPERQVTGALDQILQEKIVSALLGLAQAQLRAIKRQALLLADIVVQAGAACRRLLVEFGHDAPWTLLLADLSAAPEP